MEEKMKLLEGKFEALLIDVAVIKANYATKTDIESVRKEIHTSINTQTKWVIGALFIALGVGLSAARLFF